MFVADGCKISVREGRATNPARAGVRPTRQRLLTETEDDARLALRTMTDQIDMAGFGRAVPPNLAL